MIEICNLSLELQEFHLRQINLTIKEGEYFVLLGPTGAGKSVLLECIVGLYRHHQGQILLDGIDVTRLYPEERNIGYVPQDYAIFPNMTVAENLAYGLKAHQIPKAIIIKKVNAMLARLGLDKLAHRYPEKLSGGERQRVALGRALVTEPRLLLLDEPLCALDENTRVDLASSLNKLQRSVNGTFLHVCHNLEEAIDVADRIAIMNNGQLEQIGTPKEILSRPNSLFVAKFTRTRNLFSATATINNYGSAIKIENGPDLYTMQKQNGKVIAAIRSECININGKINKNSDNNNFNGIIVNIYNRIAHLEIEVDIGVPLIIYASHQHQNQFNIGETIDLYIAPDSISLFPKNS
ncbi:MAG: ABC transporter ATP-binding protein [Deltaproteobacteria bacterium]|nr:ABC transporter ATP-binding protein [Deltaproteobacteria bacterium]